ncbi:3-hydroxylacyl-ACP dehydratase [Uliginosibacterium sp. 31-16]|uniref:3-hydroxylacyl-ACP dehydratase n=1 Tax=Uliginosibacterium sp. 31-16 TaxID=3068315 RepID=UPI00273D4919|nr:3-hydroxylacyl-ACP dehydratase [Uliginosibacterium sp. 31-16]MDP5239231.1 3-hydroxylacyl-ACP dehydratase [Uliginosibacterium sp. 31-16]
MSQALPDRAWIATRIPHQGSMCLLDGVADWSQERIHCIASSHRLSDNPLRAAGRLGTANAIEYAAQAMAVHGALRAGAGTAPRAGFLTSVREVEFHVSQLDVADGLDVHAECLSDAGNHQMYAFRVEAAGAVLVSGRASVMLDAGSNL